MKEMEMILNSFASTWALAFLFSFAAALIAYHIGEYSRMLRATLCFSVTMISIMMTNWIFNPLEDVVLLLILGLMASFAGLVAAYILVDMMYPPWGPPGPSH
jgi:ABC-type glycerol-3-phosphate transport system permease component